MHKTHIPHTTLEEIEGYHTYHTHGENQACKLLKTDWIFWCREGDSNPHALFKAADFKSAASASSAIPAFLFHSMLRLPRS
jgi:hypothetical protein